MSSVVETLRWENGFIKLLDQRALPNQILYLAYDRAQSVADAIQTMVVRGAPAIGVAAAYGVAVEALYLSQNDPQFFKRRLKEGIEILSKSRPTAVNLFWALDRMQKKWASVDQQATLDIAQVLLAEAHVILKEDIAINKAMGEHGASLLNNNDRVLTHCNAGALATAGHGTALGVIRSAVNNGKNISVFADETRPYLQGARLTVWELMQDQIPVTLITDNMSGYLMSRGEIDAVIVGADRVAANGDVANKIGTYMVAVLAHRHQIPFYVACPLSTIDLSISHGDQIPIEERAGSEIVGYGPTQWAPVGVSTRHPAFDVTPAELITGIITERGNLMKPNARDIQQLFD
jgi:methylthioribose-1-phosphate isomerase